MLNSHWNKTHIYFWLALTQIYFWLALTQIYFWLALNQWGHYHRVLKPNTWSLFNIVRLIIQHEQYSRVQFCFQFCTQCEWAQFHLSSWGIWVWFPWGRIAYYSLSSSCCICTLYRRLLNPNSGLCYIRSLLRTWFLFYSWWLFQGWMAINILSWLINYNNTVQDLL